MAKHGKKFRAAAELVNSDQLYTPLAAAKLVKSLDTAKFDETVEAHFRLGIDTRKADQNIRGSISLPHGTGKTVRVAVFAEGAKADEAREAGADVVGSDELIADIQKGEINFDAAIATPNMMAKVGRIGKILGPRGLMPNPKLGTVTMDVAKMVGELKAGLYTEILRVKPSSAKGKYVKSVSISSTMGPGVKVDPAVQRDFLERQLRVRDSQGCCHGESGGIRDEGALAVHEPQTARHLLGRRSLSGRRNAGRGCATSLIACCSRMEENDERDSDVRGAPVRG